jgi:hypothetical protein
MYVQAICFMSRRVAMTVLVLAATGAGVGMAWCSNEILNVTSTTEIFLSNLELGNKLFKLLNSPTVGVQFTMKVLNENQVGWIKSGYEFIRFSHDFLASGNTYVPAQYVLELKILVGKFIGFYSTNLPHAYGATTGYWEIFGNLLKDPTVYASYCDWQSSFERFLQLQCQRYN